MPEPHSRSRIAVMCWPPGATGLPTVPKRCWPIATLPRPSSAARGTAPMPDWSTVLDFVGLYLIPGLVTGSIYALGAIGVSLLFEILRFAHFAHGDLMTLGAYLALSVVTGFGWPALAAVPLAAAGAAIIAVGLDRAFYRPFRQRPTIISVIASFGVMLMIRSAVQLIWGVQSLEYKSGIERPLLFFDQLRIQERHIWIVGVTGLLVLALHLLLTRSRIGRAMRLRVSRRCNARTSSPVTPTIQMWRS